MGQALYRKYRSKSLSEIVGQEHIITTLRNALKSDAISHAYLFTGPRGVGKTRIARILAHEVNGLPYNEDSTALDIIEIDAASNRRIDEIRDLRDKVHIAPASAKYKVYIIDEVHMLTKEAFNALLKTLEEPPAHAIFILATTEVHKLPETIISRTQRFTFRPIEREKAVTHMRHIATTEKITISDDALALIAEHGDGSFRDSISLLDQVSNMSNKIEADDIRSMLGIAPREVVEDLYQLVFSGTPKDIVTSLKAMDERGFEATHIGKQLGTVIRQKLLDGSLTQPLAATQLLKALIEVPASSDPTLCLEVTLLQTNLQLIAPAAAATSRPTAATVAPKPTIQQKASTVLEKTPKPTPPSTPVVKKTSPAAEDLPTAVPAAAPIPAMPFDSAWPSALDSIKRTHNTVYGILRTAQPSIASDVVTVAFKFGFHQKRINDSRNKKLLLDLLIERLGFPVSLTCIVLDKDADTHATSAPTAEAIPEPATPSSTPDTSDGGDPMAAISNIFGTPEVLES